MKKVNLDVMNTKLIEEYIKSNNLTKKSFCKMCKVSPSTLNNILSGRNFYLIAIFKIARVMKVEVHNLLNKQISFY